MYKNVTHLLPPLKAKFQVMIHTDKHTTFYMSKAEHILSIL